MTQQFLFDAVPALLHGGDYNPDQWLQYPEVLDADIRLMKEAGINCVSMGIFAWSALEPEEGVYTLDWLDERMDTLYQNGIYTILATPSGARPAWLDRKYPDAMRVASSGNRNHHGGRHNHCPSSPAYREKVRQINTVLAQRYHDHPGLILWHVSNEYGGECYCPLCTKRFQEYLRRKYHTLDALNQAWWSAFWSHTYTSFDEIEPPFENGENSMAAMRLDWKRFTTWNTHDFMMAEIAPLRQYAPKVPVTTNFHLSEGLDYHEMKEGLDVISWDSYPFWHRPTETMGHTAAVTAFTHAQMRAYAGGKPFMLMESAPGLVNWQPYNKLRRPGVHRLSSLHAVACGSDTVQYFQIRKCRGSFEQYHGAVIDHKGTSDTRIYHEVSQLGQDLERLQPIAGSRIRTQAAMVMDTPNRWAVSLISGLSEHKQMIDTAYVHYEAFTRTGVDLDVISSEDSFDEYKLLILPMLYMVNEALGEKLRQFVAAGGTVIASYLLAYAGDTLLTHLGGLPGAGLQEVFGIWNEEIDSLYPEDRNRILSHGKHYEVRDYCELIHPTDCEILASYEDDFYAGRPAVTRHKYGNGTAIYIAARTEDAYLRDLYQDTASALHLPCAVLPENVERHMREDECYRYTFLLNFNEGPVLLENLPQGTDLLSGKTIQDSCSLEGYGVLCIQSAKCHE